MTEILELMAETHPVPAIAAQLWERVAEEREDEMTRGRGAVALIRDLQRVVTHSHPTTKAEWIAYAEALEELIGEFEL